MVDRILTWRAGLEGPGPAPTCAWPTSGRRSKRRPSGSGAWCRPDEIDFDCRIAAPGERSGTTPRPSSRPSSTCWSTPTSTPCRRGGSASPRFARGTGSGRRRGQRHGHPDGRDGADLRAILPGRRGRRACLRGRASAWPWSSTSSRAHGGEIRVASLVGKGSRFTISLPVARSMGRGRREPCGRSGANGPQETILVVEDDRALREGLAMNFRLRGYRVLDRPRRRRGDDRRLRRPARPDHPRPDAARPDRLRHPGRAAGAGGATSRC